MAETWRVKCATVTHLCLEARLFGATAARPRQKPPTSACYIDTAYTIADNVVADTTYLFDFSRLMVPKNDAIREILCYAKQNNRNVTIHPQVSPPELWADMPQLQCSRRKADYGAGSDLRSLREGFPGRVGRPPAKGRDDSASMQPYDRV